MKVSVIIVTRVTSSSLTNQAWPHVPNRAIKDTVNSKTQTEEINSMWPYWEEEHTDPVIAPLEQKYV